jgi:hypothetical protein
MTYIFVALLLEGPEHGVFKNLYLVGSGILCVLMLSVCVGDLTKKDEDEVEDDEDDDEYDDYK